VTCSPVVSMNCIHEEYATGGYPARPGEAPHEAGRALLPYKRGGVDSNRMTFEAGNSLIRGADSRFRLQNLGAVAQAPKDRNLPTTYIAPDRCANWRNGAAV
jgi:hypothetical protein